MNYQPSSHDGSHITNFSDFFEWWYFDLDLDDDYHIYIVWHSPLFNLKDFYGTLIVRINGPDNELVDNNILFQKTQIRNYKRYF